MAPAYCTPRFNMISRLRALYTTSLWNFRSQPWRTISFSLVFRRQLCGTVVLRVCGARFLFCFYLCAIRGCSVIATACVIVLSNTLCCIFNFTVIIGVGIWKKWRKKPLTNNIASDMCSWMTVLRIWEILGA